MATGVVLLSYVSVTRTLGYAMRRSAVEQARTLSPGDGRITAALSERISAQTDASPAERARADRLAQLALWQDPTAVAAVSTLGIQAQIRGNDASAQRLFAYATRLSRHDLRSQIWAIENAVGRGDVATAMRHYDIALRTSRLSADLLFPVLGSAISEPAVRAALARTLSARPLWGQAFIEYAAVKAPDLSALAGLFTVLRQHGVAVPANSDAVLISRMVDAGSFGDAWRYYTRIDRGAEIGASRDPRFAANLVHPTLFDWVPVNDNGVSTSIQGGPHGGVLDFSAPASIGGKLVSQMQMLSPGDYVLKSHNAGPVQGPQPHWVLTCHDGTELGRIDLSGPARPDGYHSGVFTVPPGCVAQYLSLVAPPGDSVSGTSGQIDYVLLSSHR